MAITVVQEKEYTKSKNLVSEVRSLFSEAIRSRNILGDTASLQMGYIRESIDGCSEIEPSSISCDCSDNESCPNCDGTLNEVCSIDDVTNYCNSTSPFSDLANLLTVVKKYEYISLVENAYAQIGNKPFKLKATKEPTLTDEELIESAKIFYDYLNNFLESNKVKIDEIPEAFNLNTLGEVTQALADEVQKKAELRVKESLRSNEVVMERIFSRSDFMAKYMEVMKDTTDYPIGVMWIDDKALKRERKIKNGKLTFNYTIQSDAKRIDPCYFWATEDHRLNEQGRAVFKLEQYSNGDIMRWKNYNVSGSSQLNANISSFLEEYDKGYKEWETLLFKDHYNLREGWYDVVVCRGMFKASSVEELGVVIPSIYSNEYMVPCEIYFSGQHVLRVRVMECVDEKLGVYTTVFRRKGQSIFGYSLHEFIYPFAKLYQGTIDSIDTSMGKSTGSIIQIDTSVIEDTDKYLDKDPKTGEVTLNLSEDLIVEFDSSNLFNSPNFKGVPITIDQLPSDLQKLLPMVDFIFSQLELITGIPNILISSSNISSALRTNDNFNASFTSSAKTVQSLLRESENRILKPSIRYIFDCKAASGDMKDFLLEAEPEILLSDTLTREFNNDREFITSVQTLSQFSSIIPQEKLAGLINMLGRRMLKIDDDLIPGTSPLSTQSTSNEVTPISQV